MTSFRSFLNKNSKKIFMVFLIALVAVSIEAACQIYSFFLFRRADALMLEPNHYYRRSADPVLAYELKPGVHLVEDGRVLDINSFGVRDDSRVSVKETRKIGIVGDSVVFGFNFSQDETISYFVQDLFDKALIPMTVMNFGVPGYGLKELAEHTKNIFGHDRPEKLIYLLNLNDFTLRDSVYEGADNGLYRFYRRPFWKTPWFLRKWIYRLHKTRDNQRFTPDGYRWLYEGTKKINLECLRQMAQTAQKEGADFQVFILPAFSAYSPEGYLLSGLHHQILEDCRTLNIVCRDLQEEFNGRTEYFDRTDHMTKEGNRLLAGKIFDAIFVK